MTMRIVLTAAAIALTVGAFLVGKGMAPAEMDSPTNQGTVGAFNDGWTDGQADLIEQLKAIQPCDTVSIEQDKGKPAQVTCGR